MFFAIVINIFMVTLVFVNGETLVELSQGVLDAQRIQLTCSVRGDDSSITGYRINLRCPILSMGVCYSNCTPTCSDCGLHSIDRCDFVLAPSGKGMSVTYVIDTHQVTESGQWSCLFYGESSRPITLNRYNPPIKPDNVPTLPVSSPPTPPPTTTTKSTIDSKSISSNEDSKMTNDKNKANEIVDDSNKITSTAVPLHEAGFNFWLSSNMGVIGLLLGLLGLSLFANLIFSIHCCLVKKYIKKYRIANGGSGGGGGYLKKLLCLSNNHYSPKNGIVEITSPERLSALANNMAAATTAAPPNEVYYCMSSSLHRNRLPAPGYSDDQPNQVGLIRPDNIHHPSIPLPLPLPPVPQSQNDLQENRLIQNGYYSSVPRHFGRPVGIGPILPFHNQTNNYNNNNNNQNNQNNHHHNNNIPNSQRTTATGDTAFTDDMHSNSTNSLINEDVNDSLSTTPSTDRGYRSGMRYAGGNPTSMEMANRYSPMAVVNNNRQAINRPVLDPTWLSSVQKPYSIQNYPHNIKMSPDGNRVNNGQLSVIEEAHSALLA